MTYLYSECKNYMAEIPNIPNPDEKLKALALYVLRRLGPMTMDDLCAWLWEIDSQAFVRTGTSITGSTYYKASD
jgi:hypothetical protein